jgi:hypothetical protein
MEEDFIVSLGICPPYFDSCSNQYLNSVIKEHVGDENDLECSNIPIKQIRDIYLQFKERTLNLHSQIIPYPKERLNVFHESIFENPNDHESVHGSFELSIIQEANLDDHIMLKDLSPKQSEIVKACEEEFLENTIVNYHSSREYFHVLIFDSFYSLYPRSLLRIWCA